MMTIPVTTTLELPAIDDVADQENMVGTGPEQEIGQEIRPAAARAGMGVGEALSG